MLINVTFIERYLTIYTSNNRLISKCPQVYKGTLPDGQLIAIKRAQKESKQGGIEFKSEIELLSRVHHKNLVSLVGFCFEQEEQMLVYEYVPNGTLKDTITGTYVYPAWYLHQILV